MYRTAAVGLFKLFFLCSLISFYSFPVSHSSGCVNSVQGGCDALAMWEEASCFKVVYAEIVHCKVILISY